MWGPEAKTSDPPWVALLSAARRGARDIDCRRRASKESWMDATAILNVNWVRPRVVGLFVVEAQMLVCQ